MSETKQGNSVKYQAHLLNVYNDPEFQFDLANLKPSYKKRYHYLKSLKPEVLKSDYYKPKPFGNPTINKIAAKYRIDSSDVIYFAKGLFDSTLSSKNSPYEIKHGNDGYVIHLAEDITRKEFLQIWDKVSANKKEKYHGKIPRQKLPFDTSLVYAIFKVREHRLKKLSYEDIINMLLHGLLPYFEGKKTKIRLGTYDTFVGNLAKYYHRHEPK